VPDILTVEETAAELQVSTDAVMRLIQTRVLAASKVGRTYRVERGALERYLHMNGNGVDARRAAFERVLSIAERNPGVSSDDVLDELEQMDAAARRAASS